MDGTTPFQIEDYFEKYSFEGIIVDKGDAEKLEVQFIYKAKDATKRWGKFVIPRNQSAEDHKEMIRVLVDAEMKRYV
jgi:hypothetical protein